MGLTEQRLQTVSQLCTEIMGNGGFLTATLMNEWNALRSRLGVDWDATNRCWVSYTEKS